MPHSINSNKCEGVAICVESCPVGCIKPGEGRNIKGTNFYWIDFPACIDCGVCISVCPVKDAVIAEELPEIQNTGHL